MNGLMATYLARITVHDELDLESILGMADALGAVGTPGVTETATVFDVPGEAPDAGVATVAAAQHAAEVLDGFEYEVLVLEIY